MLQFYDTQGGRNFAMMAPLDAIWFPLCRGKMKQSKKELVFLFMLEQIASDSNAISRRTSVSEFQTLLAAGERPFCRKRFERRFEI